MYEGYFHTWRKTTLLRTRAAAEQTRKPTTTSPTLGITSSPTDNLQFVFGCGHNKMRQFVAFKFTCQYTAASQLLPNQKSSTYHSQQHSPKKVFHFHDLCLSQICYCLPLTACCPPHAALARTHPCPAFASMPARFNPRLRIVHISRM